MTRFEDADGCRVWVGQFKNGASWEGTKPPGPLKDTPTTYGFRYIDEIAFEV